jgi:hypothetical protein
MESVDSLISDLRAAAVSDRAMIKQELVRLASGPKGNLVREHLDSIRRGELLETQWEIEEVLDETAPAPPVPRDPPPEEPQPEAPPDTDSKRELTAADLELVYDDPRGFMLHKSKVGDRWFATQVDPQTAQPQTFELQAQEIEQIRAQLQGSPYWLIGS